MAAPTPKRHHPPQTGTHDPVLMTETQNPSRSSYASINCQQQGREQCHRGTAQTADGYDFQNFSGENRKTTLTPCGTRVIFTDRESAVSVADLSKPLFQLQN